MIYVAWKLHPMTHKDTCVHFICATIFDKFFGQSGVFGHNQWHTASCWDVAFRSFITLEAFSLERITTQISQIYVHRVVPPQSSGLARKALLSWSLDCQFTTSSMAFVDLRGKTFEPSLFGSEWVDLAIYVCITFVEYIVKIDSTALTGAFLPTCLRAWALATCRFIPWFSFPLLDARDFLSHFWEVYISRWVMQFM